MRRRGIRGRRDLRRGDLGPERSAVLLERVDLARVLALALLQGGKRDALGASCEDEGMLAGDELITDGANLGGPDRDCPGLRRHDDLHAPCAFPSTMNLALRL